MTLRRSRVLMDSNRYLRPTDLDLGRLRPKLVRQVCLRGDGSFPDLFDLPPDAAVGETWMSYVKAMARLSFSRFAISP